jgi:alkylation response protein AidB-like acyl-CoA dehydrogenase
MGADAEYIVRFDDTPAERIAEDGWSRFEDAMTDGLIALAAFAVGGAERAHEMAVEYAKERVQFGRAIGSFQGLAHPLAETATEIQGAKVLVYEAAWARDNRPTVGPLAAMAKMYAADVFKRTTKVGQQVFGGIGFIRDLDMQLYFRRAKQLEISWWGPRTLEERIARTELDTETPFVGVDYGVSDTT